MKVLAEARLRVSYLTWLRVWRRRQLPMRRKKAFCDNELSETEAKNAEISRIRGNPTVEVDVLTTDKAGQ